jgi:5'-3' exonuclease
MQAYKIKKIIYEDTPCFCLSRDKEIMQVLGRKIYPLLDDQEIGVIWLDKKTLERTLDTLKEAVPTPEIDRQIVIMEKLLSDLTDDYSGVNIYCF